MSNIFQKMFSAWGLGTRIPIKSNVFGRGGKGSYSPIGQTGNSKLFGTGVDKVSPLLGNAQPTSRISGWYSRISELKNYYNLDITNLCVSMISDYVVNFLNKNSMQVCTIVDKDGEVDTQKTNRINEILTHQINIFQYIQDHIDDAVYYGCYYSMLRHGRDEKGHSKFTVLSLNDPVAVVTKTKLGEEGYSEKEYVALGDDGQAYIIPREEAFYLGSPNFRLTNDMDEEWKNTNNGKKKERKSIDPYNPSSFLGKKSKGPSLGLQENREKVIQKEYYSAGKPIFYSSILKIKEFVVKDLLVNLLTLRELTSKSILSLSMDKGVPQEVSSELCGRVQKLFNTTNELASFMSSSFSAESLIENILASGSVICIPDYNSTITSKGLINTDKLSDKLIEIMQSLDQTKANILAAVGIPSGALDNSAGSKWTILQQSERLNSRINSIMNGITDSVTELVRTLYKILYHEEIDASLIRMHLLEKSTVTYNNQINQAESINNLVQSIANILTTSLQTLDNVGSFIEPKAYLTYVQNLIRDIDPNTEPMITEQTVDQYAQIAVMKYQAQLQQMGIDLPPGGPM